MEGWRIHWIDLYGVLGVRMDAEPEVIRGAYSAMARKYHPDVNPAGEARMKQVNEAYEVLANPLRKADYDAEYRERWERRYGRGRQESGSSTGSAQRESTDTSENSEPDPGPQQDSTDSGDRRGESAGASQDGSTGDTGEPGGSESCGPEPGPQQDSTYSGDRRGESAGASQDGSTGEPGEPGGSGSDTGPGPSAASPSGETPREEPRRPERSGPGVWQRAASAWWSLYDRYSMRPRYHDYREKFIPWPSLGWQQAALICSIPLGLVLAIKAPLFGVQVGGGALFLAGSYACIATRCINYVERANAAARFLGTVVVLVMLLVMGASMLALALGLIVAVIAALVIWSLGARVISKD